MSFLNVRFACEGFFNNEALHGYLHFRSTLVAFQDAYNIAQKEALVSKCHYALCFS